MLPKSNRLKLKSDFSAIYRSGLSYHAKPVKMLVLADSDHQRSLVGFVVSKAVSKQAVKRNRVKRLLREAYRRVQPTVKKGHLILFYAKPMSCETDYATLCRLIEQLLSEAKLYVA